MSIEISAYPTTDIPGGWATEEIRHPPDGDGEVYLTIFTGPYAEERARGYAVKSWKDWAQE